MFLKVSFYPHIKNSVKFTLNKKNTPCTIDFIKFSSLISSGSSSRQYYTGHRKRYSNKEYAFTVFAGSALAYFFAILIDGNRGEKRKNSKINASRIATLRSQHINEAKQTIFALIGVNCAVFGAWRFGRLSHTLQKVLEKYFIHMQNSHPLALLGSAFSHQMPLHLALNMYALYNFGPDLHYQLGREQFIAYYVSCALFSSGGSLLIQRLSSAWNILKYHPNAASLGASGAILGVIAGYSKCYPEHRVAPIFLPSLSIKMKNAVPGMMALEFFALSRGWRTFDHGAHLAGLFSGYILHDLGSYVWQHRSKIIRSLGIP